MRRIERGSDEREDAAAKRAVMADLNPVLAFAVTATILELTPGPNMTYLAALSLTHGVRTGLAAVAGIALGLGSYGVVAALGLAAVIGNSPLLYELLRWTGAAYFLWRAWESWASERETAPEAITDHAHKPRQAFQRGLVTNLLNPKSAIFYVVVLPEFVELKVGSVIAQTLLLSLIYVSIATLIHAAIVALAGSLQPLVAAPARRHLIRRGSAVIFVAIAIWFFVSTKQAP